MTLSTCYRVVYVYVTMKMRTFVNQQKFINPMKKISFALTCIALFLATQSNAACTATITASGPTNFCDGAVTLQANSGLSYQWMIDGRTISGATASSYVATGSGTYTCVVNNTCGSATSNYIMVAAMFSPGPTQPIGGPTSGICPNTTTMYYIGGLTGGFSYNWTVPAGVTVVSGQGTTNLYVKFPAPFAGGTISVKATNQCGTGPTQSLSISAGGLPAIGAITGSAAICAQQTYTYSVAAVTGANKYTWTVPARAKILSGQGTTSIQVKFARAGGNVTVAATNNCMSGGTAVKAVALTTNCGARLEAEFKTIVYPNPSSDYFKIEIGSDDDAPCTLIVRDITGREMEKRENIIPGETLIFGSNLAKGVYLAEVLQGEERTILRVVKSQ